MRSVFLTLFLLSVNLIYAQTSYQYRIAFQDKSGSGFSLEQPEEFLSQRSISRREKQGIEITEQDLPVNQDYISQILQFDSVHLRSKSKWFNDVVIKAYDTSIIQKIRDFSFVELVEILPSSLNKANLESEDKWELDLIKIKKSTAEHYGSAFNQIHMLGGDYLHETGNRGRGMLIAVIDAGFADVLKHELLKNLVNDQRIIASRDFVEKKDNVYAHANHGTFVLTTLAADVPSTMVGTAPDASYLLLRSEDGAHEYLLEEYFWVEAAEFSDSAGADVLNTSLGYTLFDDSLQDHEYSDMDGVTTRITQGSNIASQKGMLLFNSAGNSGNNPWQKISAPADGLYLIAVGAVGPTREIAVFSSRGPSADGRIKPELCAQGNLVVIGNVDGSVRASNGTSFSSPVLAGVGACLWQANATHSWEEIRSALINSGDRINNPDTNYGFGIPNAIIADAILKKKDLNTQDNGPWLSLGPNPYTEKLICTYKSEESVIAEVRFTDLNGRVVLTSQHWLEKGNVSYLLLEMNDVPLISGMYILELTVNEKVSTFKVIRY